MILMSFANSGPAHQGIDAHDEHLPALVPADAEVVERLEVYQLLVRAPLAARALSWAPSKCITP